MQEGSAVNQKLRAVREQKMWTIPEAAEAVGVDVQTYWRWEHTVQWPRAYALRKLCSVFDRSARRAGLWQISGLGQRDPTNCCEAVRGNGNAALTYKRNTRGSHCQADA